MKKQNPKIIKKNGALQRSDVKLSKDITGALVQLIFSGKTIYPSSGHVELDTGGEKPVLLSVNTLSAWVKRDNVIPETGKTLRNVLDEARVEYRTMIRGKRQENMLDNAEKTLGRINNLSSNLIQRNMFGKIILDEGGKPTRKENAKILSIKAKVAMFLTERLDPKRYARHDRVDNTHVIVSLAELRRAKQEAIEVN